MTGLVVAMNVTVSVAVGMKAHRQYFTRLPGNWQPSPALIGQFDTSPPRID